MRKHTASIKSILIIEDDNLLREMLKDIFEFNGFRVYAASHGQAGMDIYCKEHTDLVVTDIVLPGKSGLEIIRDLKREYPAVKIIAMSGADAGVPGRLQVARELGAAYTIRKPFFPDDMLAAVRRVLSRDS